MCYLGLSRYQNFSCRYQYQSNFTLLGTIFGNVPKKPGVFESSHLSAGTGLTQYSVLPVFPVKCINLVPKYRYFWQPLELYQSLLKILYLPQENPPCEYPALYGLHHQTPAGYSYTVVWRLESLPSPAHHRDQVWDDQADWHCPSDSPGHGVSHWIHWILMFRNKESI